MADTSPIHAARDAFDRNEWSAARDGFRAAGALDTDDTGSLAEASWWLGIFDEALRLQEDLHRRHLTAGEATAAALDAVFLGFYEALRGEQAVGSAWLARARRLLAEFPDSRERGYLSFIDAEIALDQGQVDAAADLAAQVQEVGRTHGDVSLTALGLFCEGMVTIRRGRCADGLTLLDEAMLPVISGEVEPGWAGDLYCQMMDVCHDLADLQRARQWSDTTERWCAGFDRAVMFTGICRVHRVQLLGLQGDWDSALSEAEVACRELVGINVSVVAEAHYQLGELRRLKGERAGAATAYQTSHELGRDPQPGLALLYLHEGRAPVAAAALTSALSAVADQPLKRAQLLAAAAEVALAQGDVSGAGGIVDELATTAETYASPGYRAAAAQWRGAILLREDEPAEALPFLRDGVERWRELGVPYEVARVRMGIARGRTALGDHDGAARELDAAGMTLQALGAHEALREVERLRRQRTEVLTQREIEVLAVVAAGATNRDVAERLVISERTVGRHLANVYVKTDTTTRTAAVAWARGRGLL